MENKTRNCRVPSSGFVPAERLIQWPDDKGFQHIKQLLDIVNVLADVVVGQQGRMLVVVAMKRVGSLAILPHTGLTKTVAGIVDDIVEMVVVLILPPLRSGKALARWAAAPQPFSDAWGRSSWARYCLLLARKFLASLKWSATAVVKVRRPQLQSKSDPRLISRRPRTDKPRDYADSVPNQVVECEEIAVARPRKGFKPDPASQNPPGLERCHLRWFGRMRRTAATAASTLLGLLGK